MTDYLPSHTLIVQMVERMLLNQELQWTKDHQANMPKEHFRHEFQTVKIRLPRRAGHTTAAWQLYHTYPSILVYPKHEMLMSAVSDWNSVQQDSELYKAIRTGDFATSLCHIPNPSSPHKTFGVDLRKLIGTGIHPELLIFDVASKLHVPNERSEDTIQIMSDIAFQQFGSMKGVVILQ